MARSVDDIRLQMDTQQAAESGLSSLNNPSQTSIYQLFKDVLSYCINYFEQLVDIKKDEIDLTILNNAVGSEAWVQNKVLEFQYSSTNPQVVSIINYSPKYATIDEKLRLITRCSVKTDLNKIVKIKVATGDPPTTITSAQYTSLYGYIDTIMQCGVTFDLINLPSDKLYIEAEVYYNGQYIDVIQSNVEAAINNYLSQLSFNGAVIISEIEDSIQAVSGVNDVKFIAIKARQDSVVLSSASIIYSLATSTNIREWNTISGYIVEETTSGNTFSDKITYIVN